MFLVLVTLMVKPEFLDAFLVATLEMAHESLKEMGTRRFEVIRQENDPTRFVMFQTLNSHADQASHLKTPHVLHWLDLVTPMLSQPLEMDSYTQLF